MSSVGENEMKLHNTSSAHDIIYRKQSNQTEWSSRSAQRAYGACLPRAHARLRAPPMPLSMSSARYSLNKGLLIRDKPPKNTSLIRPC